MPPTLVAWDFYPSRIPSNTWLLLGEARSKSDHIARIPLGPVLGDAADRAGVLRGAFATLRLDGVRSLPREGPWAPGARWSSPAPDRISPRAAAVVDVSHALAGGALPLLPSLSPDAILALHGRVAGDLSIGPGEALPALCEWLNGPCFLPVEEAMAFPLAVMKACCAHLALLDRVSFPWASGSTARLLEVGLFVQAGALPIRSAFLAAEHYRDTARRYRREVDGALSTRRPERFIDYAVGGIVHGLRRQLDVELQPLWMRRQWEATWETFARARLTGSGVEGATRSRCVDLLLSLGEEAVDESSVIASSLASGRYDGLGPEGVRSDLAKLASLGLARCDGQSCMANLDAIRVWPGPR